MANFSVTNSTAMGAGNAAQAMTTTYKSVILTYNSSVGGQTMALGNRRGKLYDILVGTDGTPADTAMKYRVVRITAAGGLTGTLSSLSSNFGTDLADSAGATNCIVINLTAETSVTALTETWMVGVNQRASYRWVAAPGSELVWPANTSAIGNNGLALQAQCTAGGYTGTVTGSVLFQEQ